MQNIQNVLFLLNWQQVCPVICLSRAKDSQMKRLSFTFWKHEYNRFQHGTAEMTVIQTTL